MAGALRAAERGVYFSKNFQGEYFQNFSGQRVYPLHPPIPDLCLWGAGYAHLNHF